MLPGKLLYLAPLPRPPACTCLSAVPALLWCLSRSSPNSYMYLGMALHKLSDPDNAVAAYDKAISLEPADPLLVHNFGEGAPGCKAWLHDGGCRPHLNTSSVACCACLILSSMLVVIGQCAL